MMHLFFILSGISLSLGILSGYMLIDIGMEYQFNLECRRRMGSFNSEPVENEEEMEETEDEITEDDDDFYDEDKFPGITYRILNQIVKLGAIIIVVLLMTWWYSFPNIITFYGIGVLGYISYFKNNI